MPRVKRSQAEADQMESAGPEFLEALARGLRVIQAFDRDRRQLSLSDAARLVDLPRASVRRTLHTLVQLGFAETDGRMFRLTPRILSLAGAYLLSNSVSTILQPAVDRLSTEFNEACSAAVLDGDDVVMIAHASPARMLALGAQVGYRLPAASTSLGRVLLAALDDRDLDRFFARPRPEKRTPFTVVDKAELKRAVAKARDEGFSLVDQEAELGFRSISVPLRRIDGKVVAALNAGAHSERVSIDAMIHNYLPRLRAAASELQPQLI